MVNISDIKVGTMYFWQAHDGIIRIRRITKVPVSGAKNGKQSINIKFEEYSYDSKLLASKPTFSRFGSRPREIMAKWLRRADVYDNKSPFFREVHMSVPPKIVVPHALEMAVA